MGEATGESSSSRATDHDGLAPLSRLDSRGPLPLQLRAGGGEVVTCVGERLVNLVVESSFCTCTDRAVSIAPAARACSVDDDERIRVPRHLLPLVVRLADLGERRRLVVLGVEERAPRPRAGWGRRGRA
jgi:hypothetical protein